MPEIQFIIFVTRSLALNSGIVFFFQCFNTVQEHLCCAGQGEALEARPRGPQLCSPAAGLTTEAGVLEGAGGSGGAG